MFIHRNYQKVNQLNIQLDPSHIDGSSSQDHQICSLKNFVKYIAFE